MKKEWYLAIGLLWSTAMEAQEISGRVVDCQGQPVELVSVILQRVDSSFVEAAVSDSSGMFRFREKVQPYRLVLQHLAYQVQELDSCTETQLGDICLTAQAEQLQDLVVTAEKPLVKVEEGKLSYDVRSMAAGKVIGNAYEAISRLPGISVKEKAFSLAGASSLTLILNGKPTTMTPEQLETLLYNTPVDRVEKLEVMYSAPPQYHVRGAAVNVVLKGAGRHSFSGEVTGEYANQYFNDGNLNTSFNYTTPKLSFDVMYGMARDKKLEKIHLDSRHTLYGQVYDIQDRTELRQKAWVHNFRSSLLYKIRENSELELSYFGSFMPSSHSDGLTSGNFQSSLTAKSSDRRLHNLSLSYKLPFGLSAGGDYTRYRTGSSQWMQTDYADGKLLSFESAAGQEIDKYRLYADQSHSLDGGWSLGYGASFDQARSRDYQSYDHVSGELEAADTYSDLREYVADVYASVGKTFENGTNFTLSATGEYYQLGDYRRWAVFPQMSFLWVYHPERMLQVSFSSDKTYPSYWEMLSAVSYIDGYSEIHGTPGLRPATDYSLSATHIWRQKYMLTFFFQHTSDYFVQSPYQSTERLALIYKMQNWNYQRQIGINAVVPFSIGSWYEGNFNLVGLNMQQRCDDYFDIPFNRKRWLLVTWLDNTFKVGKHLSFELRGLYQTKAIQGTFDIEPAFNLRAAARWTFAGGKASVSLVGDDLLETGYPVTKVRFKGQHLDMNNAFYNRSLTLRFTYRLGGYKEKKKKEVDTSRFKW